MLWIDIVILVVIALSALISLFRGFVKEAVSLATWIIAFVVAFRYGELVSTYIPWDVGNPQIGLGIAYSVVFVGVLIAGMIVNIVLGILIKRTGISGTDRSIGVVFGLVRGYVLVALLVLLAGVTVLPQQSAWQESRLLPHFVVAALWIKEFLPEELAANVQFGDTESPVIQPEE